MVNNQELKPKSGPGQIRRRKAECDHPIQILREAVSPKDLIHATAVTDKQSRLVWPEPEE